jgi:hypothetical protein
VVGARILTWNWAVDMVPRRTVNFFGGCPNDSREPDTSLLHYSEITVALHHTHHVRKALDVICN